MKFNRGIILLAGGILGGCYSPEPKSLTSPNPASSIPAIKDAAMSNDRSAIPRLVHDLDDNDSAVRFAAISALKHLTGQDLGYCYYDDPFKREKAVKQWQYWLKNHPQ